jgi:hypothetical protein
LWRALRPQYETLVDANAHKYRGKSSIDLKAFLDPGIVALPTTRFQIYNFPALVPKEPVAEIKRSVGLLFFYYLQIKEKQE